ncbi:MAG TPA: DUF2336 domain-containing protein, partial [Alphaproteobacteria bacterium]
DMAAMLTEEDVERLLRDPSPAHRAVTAEKIAVQYSGATLSPRERQIAEEIFRVMVRDVEVRVREALSQHLKDCPDIARDVARSLANDVDSVALPVILHSTVLTDDDLIEIVRRHGEAKQRAVASRDTVSARVADALVDTENQAVIATVMSNKGATVSEAAMQKALDRFGEREAVNRPMALRAKLPIRVAERLVGLVSDKLREHLMTHHELSGALVSDIILQSRERATLGLLGPESEESDVFDLVAELKANKRLTPSIILRALCMGDMGFVEAALARLAEIPVGNACTLIHDEGGKGLRALTRKAGIGEGLFPVIRAGVEVWRETQYDGRENDRERFQRRVMERMLTRFAQPGDEEAIGNENIEYLLGKLRQIDSSAARPA